MEPATVSVVITNYNGETVLPQTLESIRDIDYPLEEIILVDDGSTDKSIEIAQRVLPGIHVVPLDCNTARLNLVRNTGLKIASSDLVFLMDNDVILERDCISRLVEAYEKFSRPVICTPRLLYANDPSRVYTDGQRLHYLGQTIAPNRDMQANSAVHVMEGTAGGGILLIDRAKAKEANFFNEDYMMGWADDGEFYHRLRLLGHKCYHIPQARCYHFHKERTTERAVAQVFNRCIFILETYSWKTILFLCPALLLFEIFLFTMLSSKGVGMDYLRAYRAGFAILPVILKRRNLVQNHRKVADRELLTAGEIYVSRSLLNSWWMCSGLKIVNAFFTGYWRIVQRLI